LIPCEISFDNAIIEKGPGVSFKDKYEIVLAHKTNDGVKVVAGVCLLSDEEIFHIKIACQSLEKVDDLQSLRFL
jgi:hypothetical protein